MQSIWDYLRLRTRDSMLAGMQEALEASGLDESGGRDQAAAKRFLERPSVPTTTPAEENVGANGVRQIEPPTAENIPPTAGADQVQHIGRVADKMRADTQPLDAFERRLQQTNPTLSPTQSNHSPRGRGRPRKNP